MTKRYMTKKEKVLGLLKSTKVHFSSRWAESAEKSFIFAALMYCIVLPLTILLWAAVMVVILPWHVLVFLFKNFPLGLKRMKEKQDEETIKAWTKTWN